MPHRRSPLRWFASFCLLLLLVSTGCDSNDTSTDLYRFEDLSTLTPQVEGTLELTFEDVEDPVFPVRITGSYDLTLVGQGPLEGFIDTGGNVLITDDSNVADSGFQIEGSFAGGGRVLLEGSFSEITVAGPTNQRSFRARRQ